MVYLRQLALAVHPVEGPQSLVSPARPPKLRQAVKVEKMEISIHFLFLVAVASQIIAPVTG